MEDQTKEYFQNLRNGFAILIKVVKYLFFAYVGLLALAFIYEYFHDTPTILGRRGCYDNLHLISAAMLQYENDNDGHLPLSHQWQDELRPYIKSNNTQVFHCPAATKSRYGYAMNKAVNSLNINNELPISEIVFIYDSTLANRNADGLANDVDWERHDGLGANFLFCDGHSRLMHNNSTANDSLIWVSNRRK